ncbi:RNA 2',3'-cyclic phosphodiesterase [Ideonella azotifigens]|uniref:RNA 2',3'-cyclic phosphodiesterase n=1 Tax=Ideonella azotifigens TaxID=513160 RepID=A0ABN1K7N5_9BURK|nr:RNA 2',3'-cyclic phosphodiesterase [Ideonella azotifigens]MCD2342336.1 RNA 2',3'-cyclic phosphodiesterase [Ideonella azotifigens]
MPDARLFLALVPDEDTTRAIVAWQRRCTWPEDARIYRRDDLHITLLFLGAVPRATVGDLVPQLNVPAPRLQLELSLTHVETWPRAGVAVLAPTSIPEELQVLHAALATAATQAGFALEPRTYQPHVTVARTRMAAPGAQVDGPLTWRSEGYVLMESNQGYRVIHRYG